MKHDHHEEHEDHERPETLSHNAAIKIMCGVIVVLVGVLVIRLWDVPERVNIVVTDTALVSQRIGVVEAWQGSRTDMPLQLAELKGRMASLNENVAEIKNLLIVTLRETNARLLEIERTERGVKNVK